MKKWIPGLFLAIGPATMAMAQEAMPPEPAPQYGKEAAPASTEEAQARRLLMEAGYTNITDLQRDGQGWKARAVQSGKTVNVRVAADGSVSGQPR
ncbi:hypothetical protein L6Q21_01835 [Sandaracinobacter sp. RS1-74]|uniref:hypothetical protein n=1 Tax=Sandaracinobacteroides sayramensis TaxID=2913411 RepID=UPI001EDBE368|nr:hypothetical protein [Sandaracinobacteroides sayramensis]MCG2839721.1 hypothetical protein [Sandaracinobacteroides sayramensis]